MIAKPQRRIDGLDLVSGGARYVDDYVADGMLSMHVVRSDVAKGEILSINLESARVASGVELILTGADIKDATAPIPFFIDPEARGGRRVDIYCLAINSVVYYGQPVVAVIARTREEARLAADLIEIEYLPQEPILDAAEAARPSAPKVYDEWPDNIIFQKRYGIGSFEQARVDGTIHVSTRVRTGRTNTAPIEPRGYVARWDRLEERLTVHGSLQNPHQLQHMLSRTLGLAETAIDVITTKVGGSFGLKMQGIPEETLIAFAARRTCATVKWIEDRRESLLNGSREQIHEVSVVSDQSGRILAFKDEITVDAGALTAQAGWAMGNLTATTLPSGYDIQNCEIDLRIVATNKPPLSAARGFGKDSAHFVMERVMDLLAQRLDIDPITIRRRNFIAESRFPYRTSTGLNIDSGNFLGLIDIVQKASDYEEFRKVQALQRDQGKFLGIGLGFELTPESSDSPGAFVSGFDTTTVRMSLGGNITVLTGVTSPGGGNETGIAQIVAKESGTQIDLIDVVQGDTRRSPYGFGNFSGRSIVTGGGSAALAARDLKARLMLAGSRLVSVPLETCRLEGGVFFGGAEFEHQLTVQEIAEAILLRAFTLGDDFEPSLEFTRVYKPGNIDQTPDEYGRIQPYPTYSSACHAAIVEVDTATGNFEILKFIMAHDCGTMINPMLVEGQAHGAIAMGIGAARSEEIRFDSSGVVETDRFKTYLLPRAIELPDFEIYHQETPSPFTIYGNKGAGEAGVGGAQAAVVNAVNDALAPFLVSLSFTPITPPAILRSIKQDNHD